MSRIKQWSKMFTKSGAGARSRPTSEDAERLRPEVNLGFEEDEPVPRVNLRYAEMDYDFERQKLAVQAILQQKIIVKAVKSDAESATPKTADSKNLEEIEVMQSDLDSFSCSCTSCSHHRHGGVCKCQNCRALVNLTECGVCFESLQSNEIRSCPICANVVCVNCAERLDHCAFCRSNPPAVRNRALERLVDRLLLPCKNSRSGCTIMLDGERRSAHESKCAYSTIVCPMESKSCRWTGVILDLNSHLKISHRVKLIHGKEIYIEIYDFRNKAASLDARVYPICLVHNDKVFMIRVKLHHNCLRLQFSRVRSLQESSVYGIKIDIKSAEGRQVLDMMALDDKHPSKIHEFTATCEYLYPKTSRADESSRAKRGERLDKDLVKIYLGLEKLKVAT